MNGSDQIDFVLAERSRIQTEYQRRALSANNDLYEAWQPAARFMTEVRRLKAIEMLHEASVFPSETSQCLEVGFGSGGWLSEILSWGVPEGNLHGIEINPARAWRASEMYPNADLRIGDAVKLPWDSDSFKLVITSTLFTSVLDDKVRRLIADEIVRVLAPGGALLWYDFAFNNPRNANVRGVNRAELRKLFWSFAGDIKSVTLAPPLVRMIAPRSWTLATLLEGIPLLRTHLLGVLIKRPFTGNQ